MPRIQVAILGAGGQVGPHLLSRLNQNSDVQAWGICRNEITASPLRKLGLEVRCGSVAEPRVASALLGNAEVIIYCAAAGGMPARARSENQRVIESVMTLSGQRRIIYFSSMAVYSTCLDAARNTFHNPRPDWIYGVDKLHLERFLTSMVRSSRHKLLIVRLGHVYGAGQSLSSVVLCVLSEANATLPFDGALPSNAVHIQNASEAIEQAVINPPEPGTYNLVDKPNSTWRNIFDWHTQALELSNMPAMRNADSERWKALYRKESATPLWLRAVRDVPPWFRSLPGSFVANSPRSKQFGISLLARYNLQSLERRALLAMSRRAGQDIAGGALDPNPALFCDGAPGPQLEYKSAVRQKDSELLANWHRRSTDPDSILHWEEAVHGTEGAFC